MSSEAIDTSAARVRIDDDGILNVLSLGLESTEQSGRKFFAQSKNSLVGGGLHC